MFMYVHDYVHTLYEACTPVYTVAHCSAKARTEEVYKINIIMHLKLYNFVTQLHMHLLGICMYKKQLYMQYIVARPSLLNWGA